MDPVASAFLRVLAVILMVVGEPIAGGIPPVPPRVQETALLLKFPAKRTTLRREVFPGNETHREGLDCGGHKGTIIVREG